MSEAFGAVHADFSARVAQFIENTRAAQGSVRSMAGSVKELRTSGEDADRGLGKAVHVVGELGREVGLGDAKLLKLAMGLREVASPAGTLGVAAVSIAAVVAAFKAVGEAADSRWEGSVDAIKRSQDEQSKVGAQLQAQQRSLADWQEARARGITEEEVRTNRLVQVEKDRLDNFQQIEQALRRAGNSEKDVWGFKGSALSMPTKAADRSREAMGIQSSARNLIEAAESGLTAFLTKQRDLRTDAFSVETAARKQSLEAQATQIKAQTDTLNAQTKVEDDSALQGLQKTLAEIGVARKAALEEAQRQATAAIDAEEARQIAAAGNNEALKAELRGRFYDLRQEAVKALGPVLTALGVNFDALEANAKAKAGRVLGELTKTNLRAMEDSRHAVLQLTMDSLDKELDALEVAQRREIEDIAKTGQTKLAIEERYAQLRLAVQARYLTVSGQRQLAQDKERIVLDQNSATFAEGFSARAAAARTELQTVGETGAVVFTSLQEGFGDVFVSMKGGFRSAADVAVQSLQRIADAGLRLASNQIFSALMTSFTPAGSSAGKPVYTSTLPGVGAPKSMLATETKSARAEDSVTLHVHDHVGAKVDASSNRTASGREIHVFVRAAVLEDLATHGPIDQELERRGVRRGGRSRG